MLNDPGWSVFFPEKTHPNLDLLAKRPSRTIACCQLLEKSPLF